MNKKEMLLEKRETLRTMEEERKAGKLTEERAKEYDNLLTEVEDLTREGRMVEMNKLIEPFQPKPEKNEYREFLDKAIEARDAKRAQGIELRAGEITMTTDVKDVTPQLIQQLMKPLHERFLLGKIGNQMMMGVHGTPVFPFLSAVEATFAGETVELASKKISISSMTMSPKRVGLPVDVSNQSLTQSNVSLPAVILEALGNSVLVATHKYIFGNTAMGGAGDCILKPVYDKATQVTLANLNNKAVVAMETAVLSKNYIPQQDMGAYIMGAKMYGELKSTPIEKGNPKMIIEDDRMNGYPVLMSQFIPEDIVVFGCWRYLVAAQFGNPRITIDPLTLANKDSVRFVINTDVDAKLLLPDAFTAIKIKAGS